jgi:hypothetical protein
MSTQDYPIAMPIRSCAAGSSRLTRARALALEAAQSFSEMARAALFAYAMTGSAVARLAIIAVPHLDVLLRCIFHDRG